VVALDGKTLRRSHDRATGRPAIHVVSAWAADHRLVLGQVKVDDQANEIVALPELLRLLALEGCIVTIDAMGCQTAIARQLVDRGGDYVLALKGNQPATEQAVQAAFADARARRRRGLAHGRWQASEKGHGRVETGRCWTISDSVDFAYLNAGARWPGLRCIGVVEAERTIVGATSREARSSLSSLAGDAEQDDKATRGRRGWRTACTGSSRGSFRKCRSVSTPLNNGKGSPILAMVLANPTSAVQRQDMVTHRPGPGPSSR
jgi:predicted transposase YbfD/YdcC